MTAGEARKARCRLLDIGHRDHDARQRARAIRMRKPALLPDRILGVMREDLDAAFRHGAALDTRDREGGGRWPCLGVDRPLHADQRTQRETSGAEPRVRLGGIRNRKGREMNAVVACHGEIELSRQRRRTGLEQHLDIAAREHGADIAGSGQRAIRIDLDRHRRRRKAAAHERMARGLAIRHEVPDMVEENLLAEWQLTIDVGSFGVHHQLFIPVR